MNLAEAHGTGSRACFARLYNQALPALGLSMQCLLQKYPSSPPEESISPGQQKIKFRVVPSFPNSDLRLVILSLLEITADFLLISFCVLSPWFVFLPDRDMQVVGSFFWLSLGVTLNLGS